MNSIVRLLIILFVLIGVEPARAEPMGYQQITSLSSATSLSVPGGAKYAIICAETAGVRWRDDGTNPTAAIGMPLAASSCIQYYNFLTSLSFIQQVSGAILDVTYYRVPPTPTFN
jgi:hypothetical protein